MKTKIILRYFDGDGYPFVWFNTEEELNSFIKKERIDKKDIYEIMEVEVKRVIWADIEGK